MKKAAIVIQSNTRRILERYDELVALSETVLSTVSRHKVVCVFCIIIYFFIYAFYHHGYYFN